MYHNCTSEQLFFDKHAEGRYKLVLKKLKLELVHKILTAERSHGWIVWPYKRGKIVKDQTGQDLKMWSLFVLTGFSYKKMYGHFARTKKIADEAN